MAVSGVSEETLAGYREAFEAFDENNDKRISSKELETAMMALGANPSKEELEKMISEADTNKNGYIEFEEFVVLMENTSKANIDDEDMRGAFAAFDKDGNGTIDKAELMEALTCTGQPMTKEEVEDMMKLADTNKDGVLQYEEFVKMMCPK